uniref:DUF8039 domain-containing protein n=1 Tax=Oryza sativa subsp. japonica TaxID=39947 RepID=Q94HE7_ORYSJ|nr:Hypothetical protein [Oryza sativa Japonica Group]
MWDEFHAAKSTKVSRAKSKAYQDLQARNLHPHRLGTGGYAGKQEEWDKEDEAAAKSNTPQVLADIPIQRARNCARARVKKNSDGTLLFPNPEDQAVYQKIVELNAERQASQEVCSQRCEDDILTKALGNEEHHGRTRGIGSNVPWKFRFPQYVWQYKKHKLSNAQKIARLKDQLRVEHNPTQRRSSCTSTEAPAEQPEGPAAVDHITEPTSCTLVIRVTPGFAIPAAKGQAFKPTSETRVHGAQLLAGNAKVQVDLVKPDWVGYTIPHPPNDEILTLGAARGTFIQWPKHSIEINITPRPAPTSRPPPSHPHPTVVSLPSAVEERDEDLQLQYDTKFGVDGMEVDSRPHLPPTTKRSKRAKSSPPKLDTRRKAVGTGRGKGKVPLAPKKLDLGKAPLAAQKPPTEFTLGMPLVGDDALFKMDPACKELHGVRAIDTNLLECYSLLTWKHVHHKAPHVALLDPAVVNETTLKNDRANIVDYIKDCLFARQRQGLHYVCLQSTEKISTIPEINFDIIREEITQFILDDLLSPKGMFKVKS